MFDEHVFVFMQLRIEISYKVKQVKRRDRSHAFPSFSILKHLLFYDAPPFIRNRFLLLHLHNHLRRWAPVHSQLPAAHIHDGLSVAPEGDPVCGQRRVDPGAHRLLSPIDKNLNTEAVKDDAQLELSVLITDLCPPLVNDRSS